MKLGVLINLTSPDVDEQFKNVRDFGFDYCQLCCWNMSLYTDEVAKNVKNACEKYGVTISTLWAGWSGPAIWNFYEGPLTLGLVPSDYRAMRMVELKNASDFAVKLGVDQIATHVGFLPETPNTECYTSLVCAIRDVATHCKNNGQRFLFETGQETPITLLRTIKDIGLDNLGVNLDPANLICYGKANPIDALDIFGEYVFDVHAKDSMFSVDGKALGKQTPVGEGKVNFPLFINKLKEVGYDSFLTIEREISGEQQQKDIIAAKKYLETLI